MSTASALRLNRRVDAMQPSATLAMKARAGAMRRAGHPVIALSAGEPDFNTPAPIREAGIAAIQNGFTNYTENAGMPALREAIAAKLAADNGLSYSADQILCSNGAKQSVALGIHVLCDAGDEVLIPAPYWVSYPEMARFAGATPVTLPTSVHDGYRLTPEALDAAITDKTRLLVMCSPSNPTGAVYTPDELAALAAVVRAYDGLYVLSDEIYEHVLYDAEHRSFAALPGMQERTVTVNGFSKAYAMTGWRLGYLAAPAPIRDAAAKVQGQFTSAPSSISQKAGIAALEMGPGPVQEMVAAFRQRRDYVLERLRALPGVTCPEPQGAFYLFPHIADVLGARTPDGTRIESSEDLCFYLLEHCHVALVPGEAFGAPEGMRLSYASSMEDLETALDRITEGLNALR
ncbi:pyridoxal phosphate-dependent aminotransferase [Salisaeta longa]|uniref:pyridoxal phosphate-dependent aminotransferase n=1 Tax=Salisaeta longa TaxID=503170 RepID=UPI0003B779E2|nr:pyridoxal phosphate-dependent aminotransferase [Salisaeta longa]